MRYPAIEVHGVDDDFLAALVDDFSPTAVESADGRTRIYFSTPRHRDEAGAAVANTWPHASVRALDVDDEDWARRSQENLGPVTVGRLTITPPWYAETPVADERLSAEGSPLSIVISPSMGFGTGHHATTRLCLAALQRLPLEGRRALDVGTGSGVLALAACALGASGALAIDVDPDAIEAARENVEANPQFPGVTLQVGDLRSVPLGAADVVLANLTGALLVHSAPLLLGAVAPGGHLVVSGLLAAERDTVVAAFAPPARVAHEGAEDGWVSLTFAR